MSRLLLYCPSASDGARVLVDGLREAGVSVRRLRQQVPLGGWKKGDRVLCWGAYHPRKGSLNSVPPITKLAELVVLAENNVLVPPFSATPVKGWLARSINHQEGKDLLNGTKNPGFWTKKLAISKEFRVHVINGLSVRVGQKRPRLDTFHPWIRSYDGGWGIYYDGEAKDGFGKKGRELAKRAVELLGLQLAAVDLWLLEDGRWVVGEVNRRPALEGGVLREYVRHIQGLLSGEVEKAA